jgi:quercetin dioxygenase-like cupin family protein
LKRCRADFVEPEVVEWTPHCRWRRDVESRDAVDAAPEVYRILFENDRVRVLEVTGVPGAISPMHIHPDSVMHAVNAANIVVTDADGKGNRVEIPAGATFWSPATVHSVENVGSETVRFIRVELK